jgi:uncharacterized protein YbaR (Trm112 family)
VVSQELLDILRCPNCVRDGPEAGLLEHEGNWLICSSCDRKYPIRDDIPVMLIEEGDRFKDVAREELPEVPPPEEHKPGPATTPQAPQAMDERQKLFLLLAGLAAGAVLILLLAKLLRRDRSE